MTSRERVTKALRHEPTDRVPRDLWQLYGILMLRKDEHDDMRKQFDFDVVRPPGPYGPSERASGAYQEIGERVDPWGCVWKSGERGVCGEVVGPP
ncbi:hypothetical protein ACFL1X_14595, partial [Candidatus Hydrogenedentota bacterium]